MSLRSQKRRLAVLSALVLLCGANLLGCTAMQAQKQAHRLHHPKRLEKEEIEQLEGQWQQAMLSDDVSAMDKLLSDDYLGVTAGGDLVTKNQQLDRMRNRQVMVTKLDTTEVKFKLIGQIAIVTSLAEIEAVADGKTVTGAYRYTRVYQRLPSGTWKITSFEATRIPTGRQQGQG
jgi:ketosteroid isomerase-like protein